MSWGGVRMDDGVMKVGGSGTRMWDGDIFLQTHVG